MQSRRMFFLFLTVLSAVALLAGCGSSTKEQVKPGTGVVLSASTPTVGMKTCSGCHVQQTTAWLGSGHANMSTPGDLNSPGNPTSAQINSCAINCHDPNGDSGSLTAGFTGNVARPVVGCESCHGPGSLHVNAGGMGPISLLANTNPGTWGSGTTQVSGQFKMCTSCHELLDSSGTGMVDASVATHLSPTGTAPTGTQYTITDTHFAVAKNGGTIAGYAMDFSSPTVCIDCHDPHTTDMSAQREWAMSKFADKSASLWSRNWSTQSPTCSRCHTTTGYSAYADALGAGNATLAQQIQYGTLRTIPSASTWKAEMLLCAGCHTDNKGALRNPGAYTADYSYNAIFGNPQTLYAVATHDYPDIGGSNQCMPCHVGRGVSGDSIKNMNSGAVTPVDFTNQATINAHHYQAGAVMYRAAGYNYSGRDYSNPPQYRHDQIGTPLAPGTGTNGGCIGCHMIGPDGKSNHLFKAISTTTAATLVNGLTKTTVTITNIPSGACITCHGPDQAAFLTLVSQEKNYFVDAQSAMSSAMELAGLYKRGTSFYPARDLRVISAGTVTVSSLSSSVSGTRTNWDVVGLEAGDQFRVDSDGTWYDIASVDSATQLTLVTAFAGTNYSLTNYTIRKKETVSVTNGSAIVTGTGTNWTYPGLIAAGDKFRIDSDGTWYTIASVDSDTQLTLTASYAGQTTSVGLFTLRNTTTAAVVTASSTVTITGANPVTLDVGLPPTSTSGDYFRIDSDGTWYRITNRDATTLTLATAYTGTTVTGPYTIIRNVTNRNWLTRGDVDTSGNITGKNNLGAVYNLGMLSGSLEPAAYVHNRHYVKKLLYDSIDWMDDNVLNYSTGTTLNGLCSVTTPPVWCAGAMNYLLPVGVVGNGVSTERP